MSVDEIKRHTGYYAVDHYIKSDMIVGLGTGSTSRFVVERIGQKLKSGELKNILAIPTSEETARQAKDLGISLTTLDDHSNIDVAIDGADEVDNRLNLVKGRGAALLREKMIAKCAEKFIVVVDESKLQPLGLGLSGAMPVEVIKFSHKHILRQLQSLPSLGKCKAELRLNNASLQPIPLETDNGNFIIDIFVNSHIKDVEETAANISSITGVVEHGLFINLTSLCLIGKADGSVQVLNK